MTTRLAFSHIGLHVFDLPAMERFYTAVLGFVVSDRGSLPGRGDVVFLSLDPAEHHQIVLMGGRTAQVDSVLINQISCRAPDIDALQAMHRRLRDTPGVTDLRGVDHGTAWALYVRDPEGNRLEIFVDSPWYVPQPRVAPLDLDLPADAIWKATEAAVTSDPACIPAERWRASFAAKIAAAG